MDAERWAPRERGTATLLATVMLGAMLYPLRQHFRSAEKKADGFPLSYYPMFSARRRQYANINYVVGVMSDGSRSYLPHRLLGTGGLNQVRRQLNRVVREERAEDFADLLAARASREIGLEDVVRVEIVKGEFDLDNCMLKHQIEGEETFIAGADVVRVPGLETLLDGTDVAVPQ